MRSMVVIVVVVAVVPMVVDTLTSLCWVWTTTLHETDPSSAMVVAVTTRWMSVRQKEWNRTMVLPSIGSIPFLPPERLVPWEWLVVVVAIVLRRRQFV